MEESIGTERPDPAIELPTSVVEAASVEYLGRWNRLVSTTNWEKGRIIAEWRRRLIQAGAPVQAYCDEAWSRRVGNVSSQHVGRLRRVFERFADQHEEYPGLYWSHFHAALDWSDAEMWFEGAAANGWSVSQMRAQRWEAHGAPEKLKPRDEDIFTAELDEDAASGEPPPAVAERVTEIHDLTGKGAPEGGPLEPGPGGDAAAVEPLLPPAEAEDAVEPVRPFEGLPPLPGDLADALEAMKLAILHHKLAGWREVSRDDVLGVLDALKQLAVSSTAG